jgi:hypothetical protein
MVPRVQQIVRQTREGIENGNTHAAGKIVSLFEPDTEIIRKGKAGKPTELGKMVNIQEAEQQIVTRFEVYDQRPSDSDLLIPSLHVHEQQCGHAPRLITADEVAHRLRRPHQPAEAPAWNQPLPLQGVVRHERWVGLGAIADHLINMARAMSASAVRRLATAPIFCAGKPESRS